jgi:cytokinesis protein
VDMTASTKMKQLQWDKLPHQQVSKTMWSDESQSNEKEKEWAKKFQVDGIWREMEEDFRAKQLVINLMGKCS